MGYFPFFVDLEGREGLVVGGGAVALRKLQKLLPYGPRLTVAAPELLAEIEALPGLTRLRRSFAPAMLEGKGFVIAATDDRALNREICRQCREREIPVNSATSREDSTFLFPALVRRGRVCVGISTAGTNPAAAAYLRGFLEGWVPEVRSVGQPRPSRSGSALSLQYLLGLLLLFSLAANVAQGAEVRGLRSRGGMNEVQCRWTDVGESRRPCPASCHCRVALQLGAPPGAEAGASAGPNELFVERPEACSPALGSWSPLSHPHRCCTDSRCIKDLKSRPLPP